MTGTAAPATPGAEASPAATADGSARRPRWRRAPRAGLLCALVAFANALAWAQLTPPFHVPDENAHVAYVQYFAETGKLPKNTPQRTLSPEEDLTLRALGFYGVIGHPRDRPPWTEREDAAVRAVERSHPARVGVGDALSASANPPLYYALQAIPYKLTSSAPLLDRLFLMRLLSALLAAGTVLAIYLFLRELLPATPWAWAAGSLAVAFQPMFGFISGGVNNDALLWLAAALFFLATARAFRRGLTPARGAALGGVLAMGLLTKASMLGFVPAAGLALLLLVWRAAPAQRRTALRGAGAAALCVAVPMGIYFLLATAVWDRSLYQGSGYVSAGGVSGRPSLLREQLSYLWQWYLPRLPGQTDQFPAYPLWEIWFKGFIGQFGWLDYGFPAWVYSLAAGVCAGVLALAAAGLARARGALWRRLPELAVYVTAVLGLAVVIAVAGYRSVIDGAGRFEQARYLLPLLALYAGLVALAARAPGRRVGPAVGAALVLAAFAQDLFAQLLTVSRFYG